MNDDLGGLILKAIQDQTAAIHRLGELQTERNGMLLEMNDLQKKQAEEYASRQTMIPELIQEFVKIAEGLVTEEFKKLRKDLGLE